MTDEERRQVLLELVPQLHIGLSEDACRENWHMAGRLLTLAEQRLRSESQLLERMRRDGQTITDEWLRPYRQAIHDVRWHLNIYSKAYDAWCAAVNASQAAHSSEITP